MYIILDNGFCFYSKKQLQYETAIKCNTLAYSDTLHFHESWYNTLPMQELRRGLPSVSCT